MQAELNSSSKAAPQVARPQIMRTASLQERRSSLGFSSANERNKTSRPATVHRRNFLKGISNFEALTDAQLTEVALHLRERTFTKGQVIIREGDEGDEFFIIEAGNVCVRKQSGDRSQPGSSRASNMLGEVVATYSSGSYFGERALLTNEKRLASVVAVSEEVHCLTLSRELFMETIASSQNLLQYRSAGDPDGTLASLTEHITLFADLLQKYDDAQSNAAKRNAHIVLDLMSAFSPELGGEDVIERIMRIAYSTCQADRVGLFVVDMDNDALILKVSRHSRGVTLPISGIAGHVAKTGKTLNIVDCYAHELFNPELDRESNYLTKSMICAPIVNKEGKVIAVLQVINKKAEDAASFDDDDVARLENIAVHVGNALSIRGDELEMMDGPHFIPVSRIESPFRICIDEVVAAALPIPSSESIRKTPSRRLRHYAMSSPDGTMTVAVSLYFGTQLVATQTSSSYVNKTPTRYIYPRDHFLDMGVAVQDVPEGARLIFQLIWNKKAIAWCGMALGTFDGHLKRGDVTLSMHEGSCPSVTSMQMEPQNAKVSLRVTIVESHAENHRPFVFHDAMKQIVRFDSTCISVASAELQEIENQSPLQKLSPGDKRMMWRDRLQASRIGTLLPKFMESIDWMSFNQVTEAHRMLYVWETCPPRVALQLLSPKFADRRVRAHAVHCLEPLSDHELSELLLELVQTLKGETFNDSALARFLLRRALRKPQTIGVRLFWMLKAEMDDPDVRRRTGMYLEQFCNNVSSSVKLSSGCSRSC